MVGKIAPGRGRRPELRASVTAQVLDLVLHHPPPQGAYRWTTRALAERCAVGKGTVACILREHHDEITASTEDASEAQRPSRPVARSRDKVLRSQTGAPRVAPAFSTDRLMRSAVRTIDRDGRLNLVFFVKAGFVVPMMFKVNRMEDTLVLEAVEHDELAYDDGKVRVATRKTTISRTRRAIESDESDGQMDDIASATTTQATRGRDSAKGKAKDKPTVDKAVVDASAAKDEQIVYFLYLTDSGLGEQRNGKSRQRPRGLEIGSRPPLLQCPWAPASPRSGTPCRLTERSVPEGRRSGPAVDCPTCRRSSVVLLGPGSPGAARYECPGEARYSHPGAVLGKDTLALTATFRSVVPRRPI
jgi:hypothetical protein